MKELPQTTKSPKKSLNLISSKKSTDALNQESKHEQEKGERESLKSKEPNKKKCEKKVGAKKVVTRSKLHLETPSLDR